MQTDSYDLLVIGGGVGGLITSTGAAKLGLKVALVEKKALGGDCLHFGCVPTKALIRSAKIAHLLKRAPEFGMTPPPDFIQPSVGSARSADVPLAHKSGGGVKPVEAQTDFTRVMERVRQVQAQIGAHETPEALRAQGVETILGEGRFRDPHTFEVAGRLLKAKRIILATGSRPVILPIAGLKEAQSLTNESALQLDRLPASIIILGGGPIGLEFGQAFARLGSKVTILEKEGQISPEKTPNWRRSWMGSFGRRGWRSSPAPRSRRSAEGMLSPSRSLPPVRSGGQGLLRRSSFSWPSAAPRTSRD
jgi:pyruvate/2-oxoglutarate dehydrogenase complex dihydrolipoamide dehydrogenase (E3) component